jgi:hypothetical protein
MKTTFIRQPKPTNITSKPMNIDYIHRLTDEYADKCNSDELIWTYSSVLMNITIYSSVPRNRRKYPVIFIGDRWPTNITGPGRGIDRWPVIFIGSPTNITGHLSVPRLTRGPCWRFVCSSAGAQNCQCSTSSGVFSRYRIYIFSREEGYLSCLRLTQGVTPMSTTRLYKGYVNWG